MSRRWNPPGRPRPEWPGEAHPWFASIGMGPAIFADWLNDDGPFADVGAMKFTVPRQLCVLADPVDDRDTFDDVRTLTRHRVFAPAPYVGRPFVYVWNVAVDGHGRQLAGTAVRIHYIDGMG